MGGVVVEIIRKLSQKKGTKKSVSYNQEKKTLPFLRSSRNQIRETFIIDREGIT